MAAAVPAEQPKSKAPEQGYVPEGWYLCEGGLLRRVSSVTTDSKGEVHVFQRGKKADPVVVFDAQGMDAKLRLVR